MTKEGNMCLKGESANQQKKTKTKKLLIVIIFLLFLVGLRFLIGGGEDTWICVGDEWVKHGNPKAPKPTGSCGKITQEQSQRIAEDFVLNCPTYKFDGFDLKFESSQVLRYPFCWEFTFSFSCRHAGYGDRTGQILAQVITPHTIEVVVEEGKITGAVIDGEYGELNQDFTKDLFEEESLEIERR